MSVGFHYLKDGINWSSAVYILDGQNIVLALGNIVGNNQHLLYYLGSQYELLTAHHIGIGGVFCHTYGTSYSLDNH